MMGSARREREAQQDPCSMRASLPHEMSEISELQSARSNTARVARLNKELTSSHVSIDKAKIVTFGNEEEVVGRYRSPYSWNRTRPKTANKKPQAPKFTPQFMLNSPVKESPPQRNHNFNRLQTSATSTTPNANAGSSA